MSSGNTNYGNTDPIIERFLSEYERSYDYFEKIALDCRRQCEIALQSAGVRALVTSRAKNHAGLREKLYKRHATKRPYTSSSDIQQDIVDFAGVRIAVYFPGDQNKVRSLIETIFDVENIKADFISTLTPTYEKQFSGYKATHYHVHLRGEHAGASRYTDSIIEIQVASVLMHSWAEVEHDLIYKPGDVALSEDEHAILDMINGLMITGEIALTRLQKAIDRRTSQPTTPFSDHYELAMHLRRAIEPSFAGDVNTIIMGRVDVLFRFLQLAEMDRPDRVDPFVAHLNPDTEVASIVEQIVDRILQSHQDLDEKYEQAKRNSGERSPYSATSERLPKPSEADVFENFLIKWSTLENFVALLAQTKGEDASAKGPSQVVDRLQKLNIVDLETLNKVRNVRDLRIQAVHGLAPINPTQLSEATSFLEHLLYFSPTMLKEGIRMIVEQASAASSTDPLTGLFNRRAFDLKVSQEFPLNPQQPFSLLLLDVDKFKSINDQHGHREGDEFLKALADVLRANTRQGDVVARYGGDEIAILLPDTDQEGAVAIAEQYRRAVEMMVFTSAELQPATRVTVSIGGSTAISATTDRPQCCHEAEVALYRAKQRGRNQVAHFTDVN